MKGGAGMNNKDTRTLTQLILIWATGIYVLLPDMVPGIVDDMIIVEVIISVEVLLQALKQLEL